MDKRPARNECCGCGSGLKFKHCCGRTQSGHVPTTATITVAELVRQAQHARTAGNLPEALALCQKAVILAPKSPVVLYEAGLTALDGGNAPLAEELLRKAIRISPAIPELHFNLAQALTASGNVRGAIDAMRQGLALAPGSYEAHYNLGNLLRLAGRPRDSVKSYRKALDLNQADHDVSNNLGNSYADLGQLDDAVAAYQAALHLKPEFVDAMVNLGVVYQNHGKLDLAEQHYRKAIALKADHAVAWHHLSSVRKFAAADNPLVTQLQDVLDHKGSEDATNANLHFALGKIYDDLGEYERAFRHYDKANQIEDRNQRFDAASFSAKAQEIIRSFTPEFFVQRSDWGNRSTLPLLIIGMPRSGTSLAEQILASHPQIFGAGELEYWREQDESLGLNYRALTKRTVQQLATGYLEELRRHSTEAAHVTDKLPGNFWHLGLFHLAFPQGRIIHCKRDPLDTCLSIYFQKFEGFHPYAYNLEHLAFFYRQYLQLMEHWRKVLPPGQMLELEYEELISDQEGMTRRMIEFCGVEWSDRCLQYYSTDRSVKTASNWQVRQPVYQTSRARWKRYEAFLGPLRSLHGDSRQD